MELGNARCIDGIRHRSGDAGCVGVLQKASGRLYGEHLKSLYLFESRAHGHHGPDSDADVAVFLDRVTGPIGEQFDLIDQGNDTLLDTGVNIQPWVFVQASLPDPEHYPAPRLVTTIR